MASKYHLLYLLLQPLITPLSAQMVNRPLTTLTDLPATGSASTTLHTSTTTNATLALQPSTTSTSSSTENYYVGPSAVRFTSAAPLNSPPVDPSCCTTTQPSALGDSGGATRTCSGTVDPLAIYVTSTIVVGETITLSDSLITPTPIYITPLPLCSPSVRSSTFSNGGGPGGDTGPVTGGLPTGPVDVASRSSTILVTKKTPVIILQTPSPTQDFGGLAKTYHLDPVSATSTPGMPPPSPDPESPPTASSVLAAIVQSIFAGLPASPTPIPAPSSGQSPPGSAAGQPDTSPQQPDTSPQQSDTTPTNQPSIPPTSIVVNNIPLAVAPSAIVIGTQTFTPPSAPTAVIISGQTFTLSPSQVIAPGGLILSLPTTPPLPPPPPPPALTTTIANLPLTLFPNSAIIASHTYTFTPNAPPLTTTIAGQLLTLGPAGIIFPSTTLLPPSPATAPSQTPAPTFSALTTLGLTLALNPSRAIIANTTLTIGPGATPTTVTVDGETLTANADGLVFPSTTIAPLALPATVTFSAVDVGGLQVSIAPGEVFVSGTEYAVGAGATATTVVVGGETVVAGPGGLVVAGTTVGGPQETGVAGVVGTAGVVGSAGVLGSGSVLGRGGRSAEVGCGMWGALLVGVVWGLGVC